MGYKIALFFIFLSLNALADEGTFSFEDLVKLAKQSSSREDLLDKLKKQKIIKRVVYMQYSEGKNSADVDPEHPRGIVTLKGGLLHITFTGMEDRPSYKVLEVIQYRKQNAEFEMKEVEFTSNGPVFHEKLNRDFSKRLIKDETNDPELQTCLKCHGTDSRPAWRNNLPWKGAYGSLEGLVEVYNNPDKLPWVKGGDEDKNWKKFQQTNANKGPYKVVGTTEWLRVENGQFVEGLLNDFALPNEERVFRKWESMHQYHQYRFKIFHTIFGCEKRTWDGVEDPAESPVPDDGTKLSTLGNAKLKWVVELIKPDSGDHHLFLNGPKPFFPYNNAFESLMKENPDFAELVPAQPPDLREQTLSERKRNTLRGLLFGSKNFTLGGRQHYLLDAETRKKICAWLAERNDAKVSVAEKDCIECNARRNEKRLTEKQSETLSEAIGWKGNPISSCMECHNGSDKEAPRFWIENSEKFKTQLLTKKNDGSRLVDRIYARISDPSRPMPVGGLLSKEERNEIRKYLETIIHSKD